MTDHTTTDYILSLNKDRDNLVKKLNDMGIQAPADGTFTDLVKLIDGTGTSETKLIFSPTDLYVGTDEPNPADYKVWINAPENHDIVLKYNYSMPYYIDANYLEEVVKYDNTNGDYVNVMDISDGSEGHVFYHYKDNLWISNINIYTGGSVQGGEETTSCIQLFLCERLGNTPYFKIVRPIIDALPGWDKAQQTRTILYFSCVLDDIIYYLVFKSEGEYYYSTTLKEISIYKTSLLEEGTEPTLVYTIDVSNYAAGDRPLYQRAAISAQKVSEDKINLYLLLGSSNAAKTEYWKISYNPNTGEAAPAMDKQVGDSFVELNGDTLVKINKDGNDYVISQYPGNLVIWKIPNDSSTSLSEGTFKVNNYDMTFLVMDENYNVYGIGENGYGTIDLSTGSYVPVGSFEGGIFRPDMNTLNTSVLTFNPDEKSIIYYGDWTEENHLFKYSNPETGANDRTNISKKYDNNTIEAYKVPLNTAPTMIKTSPIDSTNKIIWPITYGRDNFGMLELAVVQAGEQEIPVNVSYGSSGYVSKVASNNNEYDIKVSNGETWSYPPVSRDFTSTFEAEWNIALMNGYSE